MLVFRFLLTVTLISLSTFAQSNPFESDIRNFEQADLRNPPQANSILFLGSSTIVRWDTLSAAFPQFNVLNRGFGGSQASDVLFFYDRIVPKYRPPLIVFYEGDNDLASGKSVNQVIADCTNFAARVQRDLPDAHILFLAIKPSPSRANIVTQMRTFNERLREFTETSPNLHYADTFNPFLDLNGQFRPELYVSDQLHLSPAGYDVWEAAIVPIVADWAARYPVNVRKIERNGLLIDFGSANSLSGQPDPTVVHWNNVTTIGASNSGLLSNLVTTAGAITSLSLQMVSRFNGANENGTLASTNFPAAATRDSLFGNTETFSGLANITPIFKIAGLSPAQAYRVSFYASRMGVSDNRETRYTITGAAEQTVTLNAANNIDNIATIESVTPNTTGEISIALTPGPNNNNANHFTYLGVLRLETLGASSSVFLFDFGASGSTTTTQAPPPGEVWNNVTVAIGSTDNGKIENLVATNSIATMIDLEMLSRFNGANENGTGSSTNLPATATMDSLFGNTELFGGFTNTTPAFKFTGLNPSGLYTLTFFASRTGVADNRETRYTVSGETNSFTDLNAANNTNSVAVITNIRPSTNGELRVGLSPGLNNNNANHFTYLGAMRVEWVISTPRDALLIQPTKTATGLQLQLRANVGTTYRLESSTNLVDWSEETTITLQADAAELQVEETEAAAFYRLVKL